ncbi:hypothetical protein NLN86_22545 [Citrobacter portucalensis]|uniref:OmpA-like domain-containing protein n=1 Tax=Citrobacter portucalensis TaxID=1639133 RepID=A0AAW5WCS8_9ENTR|nr:hypothetical protein [Citrobacter portucalensis]MCX9004408.1 hypothetical protein [Citrobacter portucalensis]
MSKQEEIDFWPGYVDALMNLVLNLLFLSAIFAVAIFVLGMESSRLRIINSDNKQKTPNELTAENKESYKSKVSLLSANVSVEKNMTVSEPNVTVNTVQMSSSGQQTEQPVVPSPNTLVVNVDHDADDRKESEVDKVKIKKEKDKLLSIFYPKDIVTIDENAKDELSSLFSENFTSTQRVIIWGVSSSSSAVSNRLTYLRIMAIRNVLLDRNVANKNISINIYGGKIDAKGGKVYILGVE